MNTVGQAYTLSAFFDEEYDAEAAVQALTDAGIAKEIITMTPGNRPDIRPSDQLGLLDALRGIFFHDEQRTASPEGLRRSGMLVTVQRVNETQYDTALQILAERGQMEVNEPNRNG